MVSKESLIIIAIVLILAVAFLFWSQESSDLIQNEINKYINKILTP